MFLLHSNHSLEFDRLGEFNALITMYDRATIGVRICIRGRVVKTPPLIIVRMSRGQILTGTR